MTNASSVSADKARAIVCLQRRHDTALGREWREILMRVAGLRAGSAPDANGVKPLWRRVQHLFSFTARLAVRVEAALRDPQSIVVEIVRTVEQRVP